MAVAVSGLVKRFGRFAAVDGLDLRVSRGSVHGFLGPNGAGKSTTLRVLLGLYRADAGTVRVLGRDPVTHGSDVTVDVSYVPAECALWPTLTGQQVLDALAGLRGHYDAARERRLVEAFALDPHRRVRTYSTGNRQKVLLIAAFAARTDLLVLDEPTSGLDPLMEEVFQHCVREAAEQGRTVLLSSHVLAEVENLCSEVTIIRSGRLVETGALRDLRHLAGAHIRARLHPAAVTDVARSVSHAIGPHDMRVEVDGTLDVHVGSAAVAPVLRCLLDVDAWDITCSAVTLGDLFLRHYTKDPR
ncbi:ABC transporter ATP-binding protein [Phycicoccus endophyticus]|uniref:ABC transporter ATP-binding protein n=1 Tax=Phycicoccus endophyticus TaxID=1690220 RepID=A0A7G9R625_9MICO|nr:ABC transporter ATP-binding protein [Phycicoccus endophyticus]QNN51050.1 ABC transporter ATP-binding protein [Phycicoccus endophyticus]